MRLKGGKVLIDCVPLGDITNADIEHPLMDEEIKVIKEKGLCARLLVNTHIIVVDCMIKVVATTYIGYQDLNSGISLILDLADKKFKSIDNRE